MTPMADHGADCLVQQLLHRLLETGITLDEACARMGESLRAPGSDQEAVSC